MTSTDTPARPPVAERAEWQKAREELLTKEKAATRQLDALAAERRRLPMVALDTSYEFDDGNETKSLVDIFEGRRQLVVYHTMFNPGGDWCVGCSSFLDNVPRLEHLHGRDTSFAAVSRASLDELGPHKERLGWSMPFYSTFGHADFNTDLGATGGFGISALLRDGDDVYQTYYTTSRGSDRLRMDFELLDLTAYGRQETWEDSPEDWPQTPTYHWWRYHDEY